MDPPSKKPPGSLQEAWSKHKLQKTQASEPLSQTSDSVAAYGSVVPPSARVSEAEKEKVKALPDLMEKLRAHGIERVYFDFRDSYLEWRKGGSAGCHGELTMQALEANLDPYRFEYWYPTPGVFRWRFTFAYWIAILFLQGSFFFTFDAGVQAFRGYGGHVMMTWPNAFGSVCFTIASYFIYLQLINIGADDNDDIHYFYADWDVILKRVGPSSCVGTMGYVLGALFFQVAVIAPLFDHTPPWVTSGFVVIPAFIGSIGFFVGGVCEVVHNGMFTFETTPADPVWWASLLNFVGSINFLCATAPPVISPWWKGEEADFFMSVNMFVGSGMFALSSVFLIVMWEGNDFGLTLFYQLNKAMRANAGGNITARSNNDRTAMQIVTSAKDGDIVEEEILGGPVKFDVRGTIFLVIYCWFVFVAVVDCLCQDIWFRKGHGHEILLWTGIGMQIFVVCTVVIILLIHSVVTHIPHEQPYHAAMLWGRFVLVIGAVCQTIDLFAFLTKFGTRLAVPF